MSEINSDHEYLLSSPCTPVMQTEGDTVLVAGATGGVGQLVTAKLLEVRDSPAMQPPRHDYWMS